ncbi:hypothetical protein [Pseudomonas veronii]|uniref:hypothetical protein n=1 Tax=Pseudomonas veronii TaxID=76761 RepID=UPI000B2B4AB4|nr:hypothetical protein [Pseudomonas veronii]
MNDKTIRIVKKLSTLILLFVISSPVFANTSLDEASASYNRAELVGTFIQVVRYVGYFLGVLTFILMGYKMLDLGGSGKDVKRQTTVVYAVAAVLFLNAGLGLGLIISSWGGNYEQPCFIASEKDGFSSTCFNNEMSELAGELRARVEKLSSDSTAKIFWDNLKFIVSVFQLIGLIYFFVGVHGLVQVSNGSAKDSGYGKPIITMFASALIVDLPHTFQMLQATIRQVGINF